VESCEAHSHVPGWHAQIDKRVAFVISVYRLTWTACAVETCETLLARVKIDCSVFAWVFAPRRSPTQDKNQHPVLLPACDVFAKTQCEVDWKPEIESIWWMAGCVTLRIFAILHKDGHGGRSEFSCWNKCRNLGCKVCILGLLPA